LESQISNAAQITDLQEQLTDARRNLDASSGLEDAKQSQIALEQQLSRLQLSFDGKQVLLIIYVYDSSVEILDLIKEKESLRSSLDSANRELACKKEEVLEYKEAIESAENEALVASDEVRWCFIFLPVTEFCPSQISSAQSTILQHEKRISELQQLVDEFEKKSTLQQQLETDNMKLKGKLGLLKSSTRVAITSVLSICTEDLHASQESWDDLRLQNSILGEKLAEVTKNAAISGTAALDSTPLSVRSYLRALYR
jgi:TolA-binding protein